MGTTFIGTAHAAGGQSFTSLQSGFTQELYGLSNAFDGGVAFAPDGDPLVDECLFEGSRLHRYDSQVLLPSQNGTGTLHPETVLPSNAGCGLANNPGGGIYSNTGDGVIKLDPDTGATLGGPFGSAGNALGIATDPTTSKLVYVGSNGTLLSVDPALTTTGTFSSALTSHFVDGIYFDPSGQFLFASDRSSNAVAVVARDGHLVQSVPISHEPDGIAFHTQDPQFVVTNNTDGTMTRLDFPANDYSQSATVSTFASGGFRGDLTQVGPDNCLYLTQAGARFDDGTTAGQNSLVRICPGFTPPPGVQPTGPKYVAFGDSLTTGFSIPKCDSDRKDSPWGCFKNQPPPAVPYPDRVASALGYSFSDDPGYYKQVAPGYPTTDLDRVGIWGYTAREAAAAQAAEHDADGPWLPQLSAVKHAQQLVTGSLGVNDLHFGDVGFWASRYLTGGTGKVASEAQKLLNADDAALDAEFSALTTAKSNGAKVVVTQIYNPYDNGRLDCKPLRDVGRTITDTLDSELGKRAQAAGLQVADWRPVFLGHGAGQGANSYVWGTDCSIEKAISEVVPKWVPVYAFGVIVFPFNGGGVKAIHQEYDPHPNNAGTTAMANAILTKVKP
jgi:lysophospholipase L1-like esterase